jgi:hypothetical protein
MFPIFFFLLRTDLCSSLRSRSNMLANMRMAVSGMPYITFTPAMRCPARRLCLLLLFLGEGGPYRKNTAYCQGNIALVTDE